MTTTISASPQTMVDSATQLTKHDPMYSQHSLFNPVGLPDPAHLQPSLAKRRTKADRRLLFELGRTKKTSTRRSSHKAMGKRMFFRLSGRHHMQTSVPPSHEDIIRLDKKVSLVSQCRLPSFRDGFSVWIQDTRHLNPIEGEIAISQGSGWEENAGLRLPSIQILLEREWY